MNNATRRNRVKAQCLLATAALVALSALYAQTITFDTRNAEPIPLDQIPAFGTFWPKFGLDGQGGPPLPWPPADSSFPVYDMGNGQYFVDDSSLDSPSRKLRALTSDDPISPGQDDTGGDPPPIILASLPNSQKYVGQEFYLINTNDAVIKDPALYSACLAFPDDTNTAPTLQIARYGTNALVFRANHFDYSSEPDRDFALLICDNVATPLWKTINLAAPDNQDGWLIQGLVPRYTVADPMYLLVTNVTHTYNAFFRVIPYSGPVIQLAGPQAYDIVSNTITLQATITDLSGTTNHNLSVLIDGLVPRYTIGAANTIAIDTRYTPNGPVTLYVTAANDSAMIYDPANPPMDTKISYDNTATLPLDFENKTYLYFAGDMSETAILTNYILFGVSPPQFISGRITEPTTGRTLKSFSGYDPAYAYVELDWNFTEADGTTPYTTDQYQVSFTASDNPLSGDDPSPQGSTTLTMTNTIERSGVRPAGWVISHYEEIDPTSYGGNGSWVNSELAKWAGTSQFMFQNLYYWDFASQTQYSPGQIGSGRDTPTSPTLPFILTKTSETTWPTFIRNLVTNRNYSDFNYEGHGNGWLMGGGEYQARWRNYVNATISANDMMSWAQTGASGATGDKRWKFRKVALWQCYSARVAGSSTTAGAGLYGNWHNAFGISPYQMNTLSGKNAGLFFNDDVFFTGPQGKNQYYPYGNPPADSAEVAAEFDKIWVMGANPFPGAADPNYSIQFAFGVVRNLYSPGFDKTAPVLIGCPFVPFAGVYDYQLMQGDYSQVKP